MIKSGAVSTITIDGSSAKFWFTSDIHFDSVYCDRKAFFSDMDEAVKQEAKICIIGDLFDALNGRVDPRRDMSLLRPEYRRPDYYDFVVSDTANKLEKYAENIVLITPGNHELSVLKFSNTYLSDRLVSQLNAKGGSVIHGAYGGWMRIKLVIANKIRGMVRVKYFHGSGGEAPVTRGAIQTNRQAVYLPDADIVVNGHSHHSYWIPVTRERVSDVGVQYFDTQHYIRTPGYMNSYGDGTTGWGVTNGMVPKPMGGCFVTIHRVGNALKQCPIDINPVIHNPQPISPVNDIFNGTVFPQE